MIFNQISYIPCSVFMCFHLCVFLKISFLSFRLYSTVVQVLYLQRSMCSYREIEALVGSLCVCDSSIAPGYWKYVLGSMN